MKSRTAKEEHPRIQIARGTVTYSTAAAESEPMIPQHTGRMHRKRNKWKTVMYLSPQVLKQYHLQMVLPQTLKIVLVYGRAVGFQF